MNTSCPDWGARIQEKRSLVPEIQLNESAAEKAVLIFNKLRLPDVEGKPLLKDSCGNWQRDIVRVLFGAWDGDSRSIREIFAMVPKKSSKTTAGAAIMLTSLLMNQRPRAEFLLIAPTLEIAQLAFNQVVGMIEADSTLSSMFHVTEHLKRIVFRPTGAFLKVKSFDPKVVTGSKPAGVLLDELHVIADVPNADRVVGQLRGGLLSQPEGFLITITTQSERPPSGVFRAELTKARMVRDGKLSAPILPMLYEFPPGVDWRDQSKWYMVTPNDGYSITVDRLKEEFSAVEAGGQAELVRWASQHLNLEVGLALKSDGWVGAEYWMACTDKTLTLDEVISRSEVITIGIDGGGLDDLLGFAVLGRDAETRDWLLWSHAWASPIAVERRKSEQGRYEDFRCEKTLDIIKSLGDDIFELAGIVEKIDASGKLERIGVDPVGIASIVDAITERDISIDRIVGVQQGWKMAGAIKTVERKLADKTLLHGGTELMIWCCQNAKVEPRGNAIAINKAAAGWGKIDPLIALFMAAYLMALNPTPKNAKSVYETRGLLVF